MSSEAIEITFPAARSGRRGPSLWGLGVVAAVAWAAAAILTVLWPDEDAWDHTTNLAILFTVIASALAALVTAEPFVPRLSARLRPLGPWLIALAALSTLWQVVTAKLGLLPRPFFHPPQSLLEVYLTDWNMLGLSVLHSLRLLLLGYAIGAAAGFVTGIGLGWSKAVAYWGHPILRLIGPLPATAWLPIAFFAFPSSWSASIFLVALASGIPVAILTWSGVSGVGAAYYDIARTLGAKSRFLVLKVAIPAAMPHVFVGLFMGLGSAFAVLVVAEMLGVKAGLGWYMQWAQGWGAYGNMYAALLVLALMCSGLVTLLFRVRDRLLAWQKGMVRW
jgi:NitT/TauT family transport system permease protein